jgi:hypothetical protein
VSDEPTAEDDFGKFFDNLSDLAASKKSIPSNFGAPDVVVQPAADPVAAAVPADAGAVAEAAPVVADATPAVADPVRVAEPAATAPAPRSDDAALLERLADVLDRRQPPAAAAYQPQPAPRLYTDEQIAKLQAVEKDYPDLVEAVQLLMRGTTVQNNAYLMNQVSQALAPTQEVVGTVASNYHLDSLHRAVPDYDQIYDPVTQWVTTDRSIPPPLRAAYRGVMESGEVSDVKWLTDEWRKATGATQHKPATSVTQAKPGNELSEAAKQAAASLAPVVSRATAVVTSADPVTFDDAWNKWSAPAKA